MEAKDLLIGHMDDLAVKAVKTGWAASKFLTPAEAQVVSAYFSRRRPVIQTKIHTRKGVDVIYSPIPQAV